MATKEQWHRAQLIAAALGTAIRDIGIQHDMLHTADPTLDASLEAARSALQTAQTAVGRLAWAPEPSDTPTPLG
jgi:hypothetical protein